MSELPSHSGLFKRLLFLCSSQILTTAIEPPPPHSYNHHLHILMQLLPLQTTTTQCKLFNSKWSMCASGWKEKDHQRKLQRVAPPPVQNMFVPMAGRENATGAIFSQWPPPCVQVVLSFYQPAQVLQLHTWWWSLAATCAGGIFLQLLAQTLHW